MSERIKLDENNFCHGHALEEWLNIIKELLKMGGCIDIPCNNDTTLTWYLADSNANGYHMPEVQDYDDKKWKWYLVKTKEPFESNNLDYVVCARIMYPAYEGSDYPAWYDLNSHDIIEDKDVLKWAELKE